MLINVLFIQNYASVFLWKCVCKEKWDYSILTLEKEFNRHFPNKIMYQQMQKRRTISLIIPWWLGATSLESKMPFIPLLDPKQRDDWRRDYFSSKVYPLVSGFVIDCEITNLNQVLKISQNSWLYHWQIYINREPTE